MPNIQSRDGAQIHYEIHGTGSVNLIFLHGWGGDGTTWDGAATRLDATRCRSFCVDLRGHGKSSVSPAGYTMQSFSEDVLAVADKEGAKKFVLVGFSTAGKLACYLAARYPDRVAALILVAPAAPGKAPVDRESALQAIRQASDWRQYEAVFKPWFAPGASGEMVKAYCQTIARTSLPVLEATAELFLWTSFAPEIGTLKLPALVVTGEVDPVYGMAYQEKEMLPFLNGAATAMLPSGHFVPLEQPVKLAKLLSQFASGL